jgi:hypothetical protein
LLGYNPASLLFCCRYDLWLGEIIGGDKAGLILQGLLFGFDLDLQLFEVWLNLGGAISKSLGDTLVWMLLNFGFELVLVQAPILLKELIRLSCA